MRYLALSFCALLSACGGGGSPPLPTEPVETETTLLQGSYGMHAFEGEAVGPGAEQMSFWGVRDADGAGAFPAIASRHLNGLVESYAAPTRTYDISGNDLLVSDSTPSQDAKGFVTSDGALAGWVTTQGIPGIELLARKSSGWSTASLNATWVLGAYVQTASAGATLVAQLAFDGTGGISIAGYLQADSGTSSYNDLGTYSLSNDGTLQVTTPMLGFSGQIDAAGSVLLVSGSTRVGTELHIVGAAVRAPTIDPAAFSGTYGLLEVQLAATGYEVSCAEVIADGVDALRISERTVNLESAPLTRPAEVHTYSFGAADGILLVGSPLVRQGFVSADGRAVVLIPRDTIGDRPFVAVLFRK